MLELLADSGSPMTSVDVAQAFKLHRSVAYRLLHTLEGHHLVVSEPDGRFAPGPGLVALARSVQHDVRSLAHPVLVDLATRTGATATLGMAEDGQVILIRSFQSATDRLQVSLREGLRRPLNHGSPGLAILSGRPALPGEREDVTEGRQRGFVRTAAELESGVVGISAPVITAAPIRYSVTAVFLAGQIGDEDAAAREVVNAARTLGRLLS